MSMDEFLKDIRDGETVATEQPFTVCSARARAELLQSIPAAPSDAVLRLLNAARWKLRQGQDVSFRYISSRSLEGHFGSRARQLEFKVTRARNEYVQATLKGLEAPFGEDHRVVDLVRGVFRGLPHCRMLTIHGSGFREFLILRKDSTEIPADICFQKSENLSLTFLTSSPTPGHGFVKVLSRWPTAD